MADQLAIQTTDNGAALLERVVIGNDLSKITPAERVTYYRLLCERQGLDWTTQPFQYLHLNGKLTLYATKAATEQLRKIHGVSITKLDTVTRGDDVYIVTAYAETGEGRSDVATGAVAITGLRGEALANAMLKAETKAKRRVTLSICGLGLLDESEVGPAGFRVDDVGSVTGTSEGTPAVVDMATGEITEPTPEPPLGELDEGDQRAILTGRIRAGEDRLALSASKRAELWVAHCGQATPETADLSALSDLLTALRALYKAAGK